MCIFVHLSDIRLSSFVKFDCKERRALEKNRRLVFIGRKKSDRYTQILCFVILSDLNDQSNDNYLIVFLVFPSSRRLKCCAHMLQRGSVT